MKLKLFGYIPAQLVVFLRRSNIIIGGLYWKRGTVYAAWTAMITGSAVALGGMVIEQTWNRGLSSYLLGLFPDWQWLQENMEVFH